MTHPPRAAETPSARPCFFIRKHGSSFRSQMAKDAYMVPACPSETAGEGGSFSVGELKMG